MSNKVNLEKRDLNGLINTIKCLTDQISEEHRTTKAVREFWSKKYSITKAIVLECKSDKDLQFVQKSIKKNSLTEESWSNYKRRLNTKDSKGKTKINPNNKSKGGKKVG